MIVRRAERVVSQALDGAEVLLHLDHGRYYQLNPTAAVIWRRLEGASVSEEELAREIVSRFDVDEDTATRDIRGVVGELARLGLVIVS